MFSKLFKKSQKNEAPKPVEDTFSFAEMKEDGKTFILRAKNNQWKLAQSGKYPYQVGIATPLHSDNNGFPTKEENEQLLNMEIILEKEFAKDDIAVFVGTIMGGGMKEFVFYTGKHEASAKIYERLRDEIKHHELQCVINNDPDWNNYKMLTGK